MSAADEAAKIKNKTLSDTELDNLLAWAEGNTSGRGADMSAMPLTARLVNEVRRLRAAPRLTLTAEELDVLRKLRGRIDSDIAHAARNNLAFPLHDCAAVSVLDKLLAMADAGGST